MQDIAERLGLSRFAVSRALSGGEGVGEETRRRVIETATALGYAFPRQRGRDAFRTRNVLFLVEQDRFRGDFYFWPRVVAGAEEATRRRNLNLMVATIAAEQEKDGVLPAAISERAVDGALAVGEFSPAFLRALAGCSLPVVMVDVDGDAYGLDAVLSADALGAALAARHLAALGHQRIGFVGDLEHASSFRRRYQGLNAAKQELNLDRCDDVAIIDPAARHYWEVPEIKDALMKEGELPTGFLCANDYAALMLIGALAEMGYRVPEDISVVGFDNIHLAETNRPPLTTIHVFKERLGERAVELLAWRVENPGSPRETVTVETRLIERGTSAAPRRAGPDP